MSCINLRNAGGINPNCIKYIESANNVIITPADFQFTSRDNAKSLGMWRQAIQQDLNAYLPLGLKNYEATAGELTKETSDFDGVSRVTFESTPSAIFDIQTNPCDWNEQMRHYVGGLFRIFFIMKNSGNIFSSIGQDGSVKGFSSVNYAMAATLRPQGESFMSYKLSLDFQDVQEFRNFALVDLPFNPNVELISAMPTGLDAQFTSSYSSANRQITARADVRCGAQHVADLTVNIIDTNVTDTPTATISNAAGVYTLTLSKETTPTALTSGDYMLLRFEGKTGSIFNFISNEILFSI